MRTDSLIDILAGDPRTAPRPVFRLVLALVSAWLVSTLAFLALFGPPPALANAGLGPGLALKLVFAAVVTVAAGSAAVAAGRPGQPLKWRVLALVAPVLLICLVAATEIGTRLDLGAASGRTAWQCLASITLGGLATLPGVLIALRSLAPLHPGRAGFLAGLAAAGGAAASYALFCPETTVSFMMAHYLPAIGAVGLAGAAAGARALRW